MRAFVAGIALIYMAAAGVALWLDGATRIENPWMWSFVLSCAVVPVAAAWGSAELAELVFRRGMLEPGHSRVAWRTARGVIAGVLGVATALTLAVLAQVHWEDWWSMAMASAPWAALLAVVGRKGRAIHLCAGCGYDLRGLTAAARGRCPECGRDDGRAQPSRRAAA